MLHKKIKFETDKTYHLDLGNSIKFGTIPIEILFHIFKDGRIAGLIMEHLIESLFSNLTRLKQENANLDFIDSKGNNYETRVVTKNGVNFIPSNMIGKGRKFDAEGFAEKLRQIDYFMLCDINNFPKIEIHTISKTHHVVLRKNIDYKNYMKYKQTFDQVNIEIKL